MRLSHIDEVKKSLGRSHLELLETIFDQSTGLPPGVPATRFRADHPQWMDFLNNMSFSGGPFIKPDHTNDTYRVSAHALPLIESDHASEILKTMESAYLYLRQHYNEHLREPVSTQSIGKAVGVDDTSLRESLCYMRDIDGWWSGLSQEFPMALEATVVVNEQALKYESLGDLISRVYEWQFINPKERANTWQHTSRTKTENSEGFFTRSESKDYPAWFSLLDDSKKALIGEVDTAIRNSLSALPTMGLRTMIERVMAEHIGEQGGFREKLKRFEDNGYVTPSHADSLRKVLDVGHASAHRAYFPDEEDVRTCAEIVKHLMHSLYILHPMVEKMSENTPPDPRRKN